MKLYFVAVFISVTFLLLIPILANIPASAYSPQKGDYFHYSETATVNNGQGSYLGYTDQLQNTGMEQVNSANGSVALTSYSYSYHYSNNQGSSTSSSASGNYSWSPSTFTYVNGTDNQIGFGGLPYSSPLHVWFAMNPSLGVGSSFFVLDTNFTVLSRNYSLALPTQNNRYVQTIEAQGTGVYQRNDSYGIFNAAYTWDQYFDPSTGYIVGYTYVEQDNGQYQGQAGSFTYTDSLYVTSTSYSLLAASPPSTTSISLSATSSLSQGVASIAGFPWYFAIPAVIIIILILAVAALAIRRRGRNPLPKHSYGPSTPPPSPPAGARPSSVDLGSKPPEQVVIREVAKVNCKFCGTLIPTTADRCPYCGGPRQ